MDKEEKFGFICVGNDEDMADHELHLEKKKYNMQGKTGILKEMTENDFFVQNRKPQQSEQKLNDSIFRAIEWINASPYEKIEHLGE